MGLDSSTFLMISSFVEVALILFFILIAAGALLAALVGMKRGVFKSTYKLLGLALFLVLAVLTVKPMMDLIFHFDLSAIPGIPSTLNYSLTAGTKTIDISANVTTPEATFTDLVSSLCNQINGAKYIEDVTQFTKTIVTSTLSFVLYLIDLLLIVILGNLFLEFFWFICFKKAAPKIAKRLSKVKVVGLVETVTTYFVLLFLFISPLTTLVNSINQGIQKSDAKDSENETVQEVIKLVDIYNDSLFARTFFNWNTNATGSGITFDTYILDYFKTTANGGIDAISISKELGRLVENIGNISAYLGGNSKNGIPSAAVSDELIGSAISALSGSEFMSGLLEIGCQLALSTDLLTYVLPNGEYFEPVDLPDDLTLEGEIDVFKGMATDIIDSGIIDDFIDLETFQIKPMSNMVDYFDDLFSNPENSGKVDKLFNVFNRIDDFKLLNSAFTSVTYWALSMDTSYTVLKFLGGDIEIEKPYSDPENASLVKDFLGDIHIGNELHMFVDSLWGLSTCGDHMIKNTYNAFAATDETVKQEAKDALIDTLTEHETMEKFRDSICGQLHMNADGTAKTRDASNGEHYALMDSNLITKIINDTKFCEKLLDNFDLSGVLGESLEESKTRWSSLMNDVYSDSASIKPIGFFKNEINSILSVVTNICELKLSTSSSTVPDSMVAFFRYNEGEDTTDPGEEVTEPSEETPFEYKDYDSFLAAVINLFDGWINPNDILGSILDLDSRVAPYLSEIFKCLKSLDNSKIVYALGIPMLTSKIQGIKESADAYFDVDIMVSSINSSNDVFKQLSDFLSPTMIDVFQHFYRGFLVNDEGKFDVGALTSMIGDDIGGFLNKLNENIVIKEDNLDTPENETEYDTHALKYYLTELFKGVYNFELFNPHTGVNANKNMQNLLNVIFGAMESFGVEKPSSATYAGLEGATVAETTAKWETELGSIVDLVAVIGSNNMLNFSDYSSNISTALLYSLANNTEKAAELDPDNAANMPKDLGGILEAVGHSYLFSTCMGGLLDQFLDGTICDVENGVAFANIITTDGWTQEADTLRSLLNTIADLDLDLNNLDFTAVSDFVALNDMLHSLQESLIFKSSSDNEGTIVTENKFGTWLFAKVETAMNSMSGGLLDDPTGDDWKNEWNSIEGLSSEGTNRIANYDFLYREVDGVIYAPSDYENNKLGWSSSEYSTKISSFKETMSYSTLSKDSVKNYFTDKANLDSYYNSVLKYDEIGRLVNVLARGIQLMGEGTGIDFTSLGYSDLDSILSALNNSDCLRIATYNAMNLAKSSIGSNEFVNINLASFDYLITTGKGLTEYSAARIDRATEIQHIVNFYKDYKELQDITGDSLDASAFFNKAKLCSILGIDNDGAQVSKDILSDLLAELHNTYCFNKAVACSSTRDPSTLSFFENMMANLMEQSGLRGLADIEDSDTTTLNNRVVKISNCELNGTTNLEGYNSAWVEYDDEDLVGGEVISFMGVLKSVVAVSSGDTINADSLSITALEASKVKNVMQAVNGSYLCTGVMKHFISSAFDPSGLNLKSLLQYEGNDEVVADFDLTYVDYGGVDNSCGIGTEIYNLETVLGSMQYDDGSGNLLFVELSDLSAGLTHKPDFLDGVFYYLYNSKVLAETETYSSTEIKGRSLLLYNSIKCGFGQYLIGSTPLEKIVGLEKIFQITSGDANNYLVESAGISKIIGAAGNEISDVSIDSLRTNPSQKEMILNVIQYTYDRGSGSLDKQRAYVASEIVSGIFDDVLGDSTSGEYKTIATSYTDVELQGFNDYLKFYFASNSTGGKATSADDITLTTFNNLNEVEKIGLDGMISLTEYINGEASRDGASVENISSNPFVSGLINNSDTIRSIFSTKLHNNGQDSRMAKILFISRGAKTVVKETTYADDANPSNSGLLVLSKYATYKLSNPLGTDPVSNFVWKVADGFRTDYYGAMFDFGTYGNALMDYVDTCH